MAPTRKRGTRFRLIYYRRLFRYYRGLLLLLSLVALAVFIWNPPELASRRLWSLPVVFIPLLLLGAGFIAQMLAHVQCRGSYLVIQLPLYQLAVGYGRIKNTRPTEFFRIFPPKKQSAARRRILEPFWGQTVLVLELKQYPLPKAWLRLWMDKYMFLPDSPGFVLLVDDWMAFHRQLDDFSATWRTHRQG